LFAEYDVDAIPRNALVAFQQTAVKSTERIVVRYDLAFQSEGTEQVAKSFPSNFPRAPRR